MDDFIQTGIVAVLEDKGLETGIKEMLDYNKQIKHEAKKYYIEEKGDEILGEYHNEILYTTFQLEVISTILRYKPLYEDRKHIKTLCNEIRTIVDDLEKLVKEEK